MGNKIRVANDIVLKHGDIVAEGRVGDIIWDGDGVIVKRPIGVVHVYSNPKNTIKISPDVTDYCNIIQIRTGEVEITHKAKQWMHDAKKDDQTIELHLSQYDGRFYNWDNIEIIGNVENFI